MQHESPHLEQVFFPDAETDCLQPDLLCVVFKFSGPSRESVCIAHSQRLTLYRAVSNTPPLISQPAQSYFPAILMSPSHHSPSPTVLCIRAAPGHSCLSAALPTFRSSLCPRSPAHISSRGCHFYPSHSFPLRCPWVSTPNSS